MQLSKSMTSNIQFLRWSRRVAARSPRARGGGDCSTIAGTGMSVMEMSHRSAEFIDIAQTAEADLRELLGVPDDYAVLFLQGGATAQFAAVPLNLLGDKVSGRSREYRRVGQQSDQRGAALLPARTSSRVVEGNATSIGFRRASEWQLDPDAAYVHIIGNETIGGVEFHDDSRRRRRAARRRHVEHAAVASARRHAVRRDLCGRAKEHRPRRSRARHRAARSARTRARRYAERARLGAQRRQRLDVQHAGDVFVVHRRARVRVDEAAGRPRGDGSNAIARKAQKLYRAIDASNFYHAPVVEANRSLMNVTFTLADDALDKAFLKGAEAAACRI